MKSRGDSPLTPIQVVTRRFDSDPNTGSVAAIRL
jgi:hypothetical protein